MRNILVPTDFSEISRYALDLAQKIAHHTGAGIYLLKVVPAPAEAVYDANHNLVAGDAYDLKVVSEAQQADQQKLHDWGEEATYVTKAEARVGRLTEEIMSAIEREKIDLVVMATHGAHGLKEMITGSHTEHIVRNSPVPVLSLKCDRFDLDFNHIAIAGDFHRPVKQHLEVILDLQKAFDATLHLVKINTRRDFETSRAVKAHFDEFVGKNGLDKVEYHLYCDEDVEQGILHFSEDFGVDMITMGTHQRKGINHWINGSISEDVVNHLMRPILTYKI